ncbi:MAG: hypothetical protein IT446_15045 [Phycisphaerales bacterium]|nr:hypothetical protein [Phycisphaerales bacterium]
MQPEKSKLQQEHEEQLSCDVAAMRRSREQIDQGKSRDVDEVFNDITSRLLEKMKQRRDRHNENSI